jgi:hypothetical protein
MSDKFKVLYYVNQFFGQVVCLLAFPLTKTALFM